MGTRADYYIGRGLDAEWLGSTAWDGNPSAMRYNPSRDFDSALNDIQLAIDKLEEHGKTLYHSHLDVYMMKVPLEYALKDLQQFKTEPSITKYPLLEAKTEEEFRHAFDELIATRDDFTSPEEGWPWPWEDSNTTDFAYAFDEGRVWASCFGGKWFAAMESVEHDWEPVKDEYRETDIEDEEEYERLAKLVPTGDKPTFPDMSARRNIQMNSQKGGIIVMAADQSGKMTVK